MDKEGSNAKKWEAAKPAAAAGAQAPRRTAEANGGVALSQVPASASKGKVGEEPVNRPRTVLGSHRSGHTDQTPPESSKDHEAEEGSTAQSAARAQEPRAGSVSSPPAQFEAKVVSGLKQSLGSKAQMRPDPNQIATGEKELSQAAGTGKVRQLGKTAETAGDLTSKALSAADVGMPGVSSVPGAVGKSLNALAQAHSAEKEGDAAAESSNAVLAQNHRLIRQAGTAEAKVTAASAIPVLGKPVAERLTNKKNLAQEKDIALARVGTPRNDKKAKDPKDQKKRAEQRSLAEEAVKANRKKKGR